jgi:hypothetical protein
MRRGGLRWVLAVVAVAESESTAIANEENVAVRTIEVRGIART